LSRKGKAYIGIINIREEDLEIAILNVELQEIEFHSRPVLALTTHPPCNPYI